MPKRLVVATLLLFVTICSSSSLVFASKETSKSTAAVHHIACGDELSDELIECYRIFTADDTSQPFSLGVTLLRSTSRHPKADPIVFVAGGPGEAASADVKTFLSSPLRAERDIYLPDPRGAGMSEPNLACPEVTTARVAVFSAAATVQDETSAMQAAAGQCANRLREQGIELEAFNSRTLAGDLDMVRRAFGIEAWNLYAVSYGTRVALEAVRSYPRGIRSVVLDSAYPPDELETRLSVGFADVQGGFDHLFAACASAPDCDESFPALDTRFIEMVERYNDEPYSGTTTIPSTGESLPITLTGNDLAAFVFLALKDERSIPSLPLLLTALAAGNSGVIDDAIAPVVGSALDDDPALFSFGAQVSIDCVDTGAATDDADRALERHPGEFGTMLLFSSGTYCDSWGIAPGLIEFNQAVTSDLAVLLTAGAFDPISLPATTRHTSETLPNGLFLEFPASGHAPTFTNECAGLIVSQFFDAPTGYTADACLGAETAPTFTSR